MANDLSKSVLGVSDSEIKSSLFSVLGNEAVKGVQLRCEGKRPNMWLVPVTGNHVGGRVTHSGIFPKWLHKTYGGLSKTTTHFRA